MFPPITIVLVQLCTNHLKNFENLPPNNLGSERSCWLNWKMHFPDVLQGRPSIKRERPSRVAFTLLSMLFTCFWLIVIKMDSSLWWGDALAWKTKILCTTPSIIGFARNPDTVLQWSTHNGRLKPSVNCLPMESATVHARRHNLVAALQTNGAVSPHD